MRQQRGCDISGVMSLREAVLHLASDVLLHWARRKAASGRSRSTLTHLQRMPSSPPMAGITGTRQMSRDLMRTHAMFRVHQRPNRLPACVAPLFCV